jgi:hypothetical protein
MSACLKERNKKPHQNEQGLSPSPFGLQEEAIYESCPLYPLGTCSRSITADGQYVWSFSLVPHIKLSLCQMSCHQIWCCKEIAIIFIRFFFLWPLDFIQSTQNPSRWFREHVSSKSIAQTVPDSLLPFHWWDKQLKYCRQNFLCSG